MPEQITSRPSAERLVAHRGYPHAYPENTLAGIRAALAAGASYIEVDVQLSRDEVPVLFHDRDLQRLCKQSGAVHDYTWQQLQQFAVFATSSSAAQLEQTALTNLAELVDLIVHWPAARFFIELKRITLAQLAAPRFVEIVLDTLEPVVSQCVIISYGLELLQAVRDRSAIALGVVIDDWQEHQQATIATLHPEYLFFDIETLPPAAQVGFQNSTLVCFETIDPVQARQAMQQGVSLVETFAIAEMRAQLAMLE